MMDGGGHPIPLAVAPAATLVDQPGFTGAPIVALTLV